MRLAVYGRSLQFASIILCFTASAVAEVLGLILLVNSFGKYISGLSQVSNPLERWWLGFAAMGSFEGSLLVFMALGFLAVTLKLVGQNLENLFLVQCENRLRGEIFQKFLSVEWQHYLSSRLGKINDLALSRPIHVSFAVSHCLGFFCEFFGAIMALGIAVFLSPKLTLIICGFVAVFASNALFFRKRIRKYSDQISAFQKSVGFEVEQTLGNLKYVRSSGESNTVVHKFNQLLKQGNRSLYKAHFLNSLSQSLLHMGGVVLIVLIFFVSTRWKWFSVSEGAIFMAIFYRLVPKLQLMYSHYAGIRLRGSVVRDFVAEAGELQSWREENKGASKLTFDREMKFENVSFEYRTSHHSFQIRQVTFSLKRGGFLALVGESGGGKSTLVDLVTGLLSPDTGRITVDGEDLRSGDLNQWREKIGLVLQDVPVFNTSLARNIAWMDPHPDLEWARECAHRAGVMSYAKSFHEGLSTLVGHGGLRLSGGQRQRLALARALYRKPQLLVLDEATSHLDGGTELQFHRELEKLKGDHSILLIAHRMKSVALADEILVIQDGYVTDRGTWAELSNRESWLLEMLNLQSKIQTKSLDSPLL